MNNDELNSLMCVRYRVISHQKNKKKKQTIEVKQ